MNKQATQLVSVLLLVLAVVLLLVFVLPMRGDNEGLRAQRDQGAADLQVLEADLQELISLSEQVAGSEAVRMELLRAVPKGVLQDELLVELSELAEESGFTMNAVNFTLPASQSDAQTVQIAANLSGSYEDLDGFLQDIESASRLMQVRSMNVQRTTNATVNFNLTIEAYYQ